MAVWLQLLLALAICSTMMAILWFIQRQIGDAGVVDVGWCGGLAVLSVFYGLTSSGYEPRRFLVMGMGAIWAGRLTLYLLFNRVIAKGEDGRYQTLRAKYGPKAQRFFFLFFQAQALLDIFFGLPLLVVAHHGAPRLTIADYLGFAVWAIAVIGESVADWQLARFRGDPSNKGKTCRVGLWNYSRHPNYFFEWLHWWSYVFMAAGSRYWAVTLIGPSTMLYFLLKVTGIPATEAQALKSRGEDYRRYQETTSGFVPWFPRKRD